MTATLVPLAKLSQELPGFAGLAGHCGQDVGVLDDLFTAVCEGSLLEHAKQGLLDERKRLLDEGHFRVLRLECFQGGNDKEAGAEATIKKPFPSALPVGLRCICDLWLTNFVLQASHRFFS